MFKFKPVSPWIGGLIAAMTGLVAVMSASADGQAVPAGEHAVAAVMMLDGGEVK